MLDHIPLLEKLVIIPPCILLPLNPRSLITGAGASPDLPGDYCCR